MAAGGAPGPPAVLACNVYVSEGTDASVIRRILDAASGTPGVANPYHFVDAPYGRSSFTLVSREEGPLAECATRVAAAAASLLDLRAHAATHPRLGVVDHISCHPLGAAAVGSAARVARRVGERLGAEAGVSVLFYGAADVAAQRRLRDVRRSLRYFQGSGAGQPRWAGAVAPGGGPPPDAGPREPDPRLGYCLVGAVPWLVNYNVAVRGCDMGAAREIARRVSERGGGLPAVEAMALTHGGETEIACNLLDASASPPGAVLAAVRALAEERGATVAGDYRIGLTPEELVAAAG